MDKLFKKLIDSSFSDLQGAIVEASIPVPEALINEILRAALEGNKNIESIYVSVHPQNKVSAEIKTTLLSWALKLKLRLDKFVDLASYSSPKIRAWLENHRVLGSLGSFFNVLPEGIKLYGDQVVVDLGVFFREPEQKRMLALVKSIDIRTEEGKVILDIKIEIDK